MTQTQIYFKKEDDGPLLYYYGRFIFYICQLALAGATALLIIDLLVLGLAVPMRYFFSKPIIWGDEVIALSLTSIVMLGAPEVLRRNEHIGVDIFVSQLKGRALEWAVLWANFSILSMAGILIINGWHTAMFSKMIGSLTDGHLELPLWLLQLLLPIGGVLLLLVTFEHLWRSLRKIMGFSSLVDEPEPPHDPHAQQGEGN